MISDEEIQLISMLFNHSSISGDLTAVDHTKNGLSIKTAILGQIQRVRQFIHPHSAKPVRLASASLIFSQRIWSTSRRE